MENRLTYTKAILLLLSGIVSIILMFLVGSESNAYGFLTGYGYTASFCGAVAIVYTYLKKSGSKETQG
ncbi:hypothetical protein H7F15_17295 [Pontibacter sp. Tf4]|nr:hypothetical protein [Pontibacter sp. Tf4]